MKLTMGRRHRLMSMMWPWAAEVKGKMKRVKHLGVSAVMGNVYYGSIAKDGMGWQSDKTEVPKSEFVQAIFDWVKHQSEGTNVVEITRIDSVGKHTPFAEIIVKYHAEQNEVSESSATPAPQNPHTNND